MREIDGGREGRRGREKNLMRGRKKMIEGERGRNMESETKVRKRDR